MPTPKDYVIFGAYAEILVSDKPTGVTLMNLARILFVIVLGGVTVLISTGIVFGWP